MKKRRESSAEYEQIYDHLGMIQLTHWDITVLYSIDTPHNKDSKREKLTRP